MSEITKEEIAIMIDVQSKTVVNLEKIATALHEIVAEQKHITEAQTKIHEEMLKGTVATSLKKIENDVFYNKVLFSVVSIAIVVVSVVMHFMKW